MLNIAHQQLIPDKQRLVKTSTLSIMDWYNPFKYFSFYTLRSACNSSSHLAYSLRRWLKYSNFKIKHAEVIGQDYFMTNKYFLIDSLQEVWCNHIWGEAGEESIEEGKRGTGRTRTSIDSVSGSCRNSSLKKKIRIIDSSLLSRPRNIGRPLDEIFMAMSVN